MPFIVLDDFISDYPGTPYREDALFYLLDSSYEIAVNSVEAKKLERLKNAKKIHDELVRTYPETKYLDKSYEMINVIDTLNNNFLPNYSTNYKFKAIYLGYVCRQLLLTHLGIIKETDRDSYTMKRINRGRRESRGPGGGAAIRVARWRPGHQEAKELPGWRRWARGDARAPVRRGTRRTRETDERARTGTGQ